MTQNPKPVPPFVPGPEAIAEAIATLYQAHERLEMNNYDDEETPFMQDCLVAIALLEGRNPS